MRVLHRIRIRLIVIFFSIVTLVGIGLVLYSESLKSNLFTATEKTLLEISNQQAFNLEAEIESEMLHLQNLSATVPYIPGDEEMVTMVLEKAAIYSHFNTLLITNLDGTALTHKGEYIPFDGNLFLENSAQEYNGVMVSKVFEQNGHMMICLGSRIVESGYTVGLVAGTYDLHGLDDLLLPSFDGRGYSYVVDLQGNLLSATQNEYTLVREGNVFETLKGATFENGASWNQVSADLAARQVGRITYLIEDQRRLAQYRPLPISGWYLFTVVPDAVITAEIGYIAKSTAFLAGAIILGFALFISYILHIQNQATKDRERYTQQVERVAYYDDLTGLPNLTKFKMESHKALIKFYDKPFVVAKFDIVNFKMINDIFGFATGDEVVRQVAAFVQEIRNQQGLEKGSLGRINGDEFVLLDEGDSVEETEMRRSMFEQAFNEHIHHLLGAHKIEFRYGRYFLEPGEQDMDSVMEKVNLAHRAAKNEKNCTIYDYDEQLRNHLLRETLLEARMENALENGEFLVYLQPKYSLDHEKIVGAEALVRWKMSDGKLIPPIEFIPLFERNTFVLRLDMHMFHRVCLLLSQRLQEGLPIVPISVNFSRLHLRNPNFVADIAAVAAQYGVPTSYLEIELTESTIFDNEEVLTRLIEQLHEAKFILSMDDFGSGYSSLGLLQNLPVDVIKIDKGFFAKGDSVNRARAVIESMIEMAKRLDIYTVAEGVEQQEHIELLRNAGCDCVQGYYYAKPMPAEELFAQDDRFASPISITL